MLFACITGRLLQTPSRKLGKHSAGSVEERGRSFSGNTYALLSLVLDICAVRRDRSQVQMASRTEMTDYVADVDVHLWRLLFLLDHLLVVHVHVAVQVIQVVEFVLVQGIVVQATV